MMNRLVVNLTPTGMVPTKEMTPHVPLSVDEIVSDVARCVELHGITMVHLHARDERGEPTWSREVYAKLIGGIRDFAPDLVVCVSLSGRNVQDIDKRADPLLLEGGLKPDMGSLTLSSMNFSMQASVNPPDTVQELARRMQNRGILPELEAFDLGMVNYGQFLIGRGLVRQPSYWNLFLGSIAGAQAELAHAGLMARDVPSKALWSFGGIGDAQLAAHGFAVAAGGGVRVGLEDSIYHDASRKDLATNEGLVRRAVHLGEIFGRKVMRPAQFREIMGLEKGNGSYGLPR